MLILFEFVIFGLVSFGSFPVFKILVFLVLFFLFFFDKHELYFDFEFLLLMLKVCILSFYQF